MTDATPPHAHRHSECYACPVGAFFSEFQSAQPEALEHLLNAAYELLEVARVAIDAAERAIDEQRANLPVRDPEQPAPARPAGERRRVRRIDIA